MRKFYSAIMALSVLLFASCDKNENGPDLSDDGGIKAKMNLVISFPQTTTRATDVNATAAEVKVNSIHVFIFNPDGTPAAGHNSVALADFTPDGNTYTLDDPIETTSGNKKIYVGINLPSTLIAEENESLLIGAAVTGNLVDGNGNIAMLANTTRFLEAVEVEVVEGETPGTPETPENNIITVDVDRLVAKVAVRNKENGTDDVYTVDNAEGDIDGGKFKVTPDEYSVGNLATHFYPAQRKSGGKLVAPMMGVSNAPIGLELKEINAHNTTVASAKTFYVPEHTTSALNLREEATYAVVRGQFTFEKLASIIEGEDDDEDELVLTETPPGFCGSVWAVTYGGFVYFCESLAIANQVGVYLDKDFAKIYEFKDASEDEGEYYTFYHVFLNNLASISDRLAVYRNQFIDIKISDVKGLGVPGDPDDPKTPPPFPPDPKDPVYTEFTLLELIVNIAEWDWKPQSYDLQ